MNMKLDMLHISMSNMIINNLNNSLIITVNNSRGLNKKSNLFMNLSDPKYLSSYIDNTMILGFYGRKRDYLMFLT